MSGVRPGRTSHGHEAPQERPKAAIQAAADRQQVHPRLPTARARRGAARPPLSTSQVAGAHAAVELQAAAEMPRAARVTMPMMTEKPAIAIRCARHVAQRWQRAAWFARRRRAAGFAEAA